MQFQREELGSATVTAPVHAASIMASYKTQAECYFLFFIKLKILFIYLSVSKNKY